METVDIPGTALGFMGEEFADTVFEYDRSRFAPLSQSFTHLSSHAPDVSL